MGGIPLLVELHAWMEVQRTGLSDKSTFSKVLRHAVRRSSARPRNVDDGCPSTENSSSERPLRGTIVLHNVTAFSCGADTYDKLATAFRTVAEAASSRDFSLQAYAAGILVRLAVLRLITCITDLRPSSLGQGSQPAVMG